MVLRNIAEQSRRRSSMAGDRARHDADGWPCQHRVRS